jgi:hypothetical protein
LTPTIYCGVIVYGVLHSLIMDFVLKKERNHSNILLLKSDIIKIKLHCKNIAFWRKDLIFFPKIFIYISLVMKLFRV